MKILTKLLFLIYVVITFHNSHFLFAQGTEQKILPSDGAEGGGSNPIAITLIMPANGSTANEFPTLSVAVSDNSSTNLIVKFYGRIAEPSDVFKIIKLPDTQWYSASLYGGTPAMFNSQTQWIVNNRTSQNIIYVSHMGDLVANGDANQSEWDNAKNAMYLLDDASVPYGVALGNRDRTGGTTKFEASFGVSHFNGYSYYGGPYSPTSNMSHYDLITSGGLDFIIIYLEYAPPSAVLSWADDLLSNNLNRRGIVVSHDILKGGSLSTFGTWILNALEGNQNLFMMFCGHRTGEKYLLRTGTNGNPIHILLADYTGKGNGGDGWLRIMEFDPPCKFNKC